MPEQLLQVLQICLLILLYLFFLRVVRAVWVEVNGPRPRRQPSAATAPPAAVAPASGTRTKRDRRTRRSGNGAAAGPVLVLLAPQEHAGRAFTITDELTLGRAAGCQITLDDSYASQLHARVFTRDGAFYVEDLGSTNGTYLNRGKVSGPMLLKSGDQLQVGSTVMEFRP